jgi:hypothetical protein
MDGAAEASFFVTSKHWVSNRLDELREELEQAAVVRRSGSRERFRRRQR